MTTWTEAEIREAVERGCEVLNFDDMTSEALAPLMDSDMARVRGGWDRIFRPGDDHPGTLWADLTAAEAAELQDALNAVVHRVEVDATRLIVEGCVAVGVAFAEAHPDIPRGAWKARELIPA